MKTKNIVVIGFMCSGKTTIGREIAKKLRRSFYDTDEIIEQEMDMSVPEIFEKKGEWFFRKKEREVVQKLHKEKNCVIAAGGGIPLNSENMKLLKKSGVIVDLLVSVDVLAERIRNHRKSRPLVRGKTKEEIKEMYKLRETCYKDADLCINITDLNPKEAADRIIEEVGKLEV